MQPRLTSDSTSFSNWSLFHHNSAICQMLTFNRNSDLLAEHRERQGWKSICFIAIYLPGSSALRSWMRGLAGFRATRTPSCLTPAKNSQDSFPLTRELRKPTTLLNKTSVILLVSRANSHWLTAAKLPAPISFTQQQQGILGSTLHFLSKILWYFNHTFWGRGTALYPSLKLSLFGNEIRSIKIFFEGQLCKKRVNRTYSDTSWLFANYSTIFI